jgi:sirohydrochlorin cobaltochelatase
MSTTRSDYRLAPATDGAAADWRDAALLLVAHGSRLEPRATATFLAQAQRLADCRLFAEVAVGQVRAEPQLDDALARLQARLVYVVPMLMADGYLARTALPKILELSGPVTERTIAGRPRQLRYCDPVGTHPGLAMVLRDNLLASCATHGLEPKRTRALLAAHGNLRDPSSGVAARAHAATLAGYGCFASVAIGYLLEPPLLADALAKLAGKDAAIVGLFAADGNHAVNDVPNAIAAEQARRGCAGGTMTYGGAVGCDPAIADLVVDRVSQFDRAQPRQSAA